MFSLTIKEAIASVGGAIRAGSVCGVSPRAVYKWMDNGCLPRTEYTAETCYAEKLAQASGGAFTATELLEKTAPNRTVRVSMRPEAG